MSVFYVGKGKDYRAYDRKRRNKYFKNILKITKCGVKIVFSDLTEDEAFTKEIELIEMYKKKDQCEANLTKGGEGASGIPLSESKKLVFTMNGKHHSQKTKEKMRESSTGQIMSKESRLKMSLAKKGTKMSIETRLKMSLSQKARYQKLKLSRV